jgi:hypothetical protein
MSKFVLIVIGAATASFLATGGHVLLPGVTRYVQANVSTSCRIKGNISINSGERIYHMPGQEYYEDTRIRPEFGERWFCSEADARAAGWRRARQ